MNTKDYNLLLELSNVISKVPFPVAGGSSKTASVEGFVSYSEDMRSFIPMIRKLLDGMLMSDMVKKSPEMNQEYVIGKDYENPKLILEALKQWIVIRSEARWNNDNNRRLLDQILTKIKSNKKLNWV